MECGEVSAYEINIMELLASFHHDLRFDPSLYPILHNFPIDSSLSPPHLFFTSKSLITSTCVSSFHSLV